MTHRLAAKTIGLAIGIIENAPIKLNVSLTNLEDESIFFLKVT